MTIQGVQASLSDGNLGVSPGSPSGVMAVIGNFSTLTAGTAKLVSGVSGAKTTGFGPGAETLAGFCANSGVPVIASQPTVSAGANGSVTQAGSGSPPAVTVTGTPNDAYDTKVKITLGGAVGTAKFIHSEDGGNTWSAEIFTASTYPVDTTGLTIAFAAGTYVAADVYSFTSTAPSYSTTQMAAAIDAIIAARISFSGVYLSGTAGGNDDAAKATACLAMAAALSSKLEALAAANGPDLFGIMEAPAIAEATLKTTFASFVGKRVHVVAGTGTVLSDITGRINLVNVGRMVASRLPATKLSKDPSQKFPDAVGVGPLPAQLLSIARDEYITPNLDAARFVTVRTWDDTPGFYITDFPSMAVPGSDFYDIPHLRVINELVRLCRSKGSEFLSRDLDLQNGGTLSDPQATSMDTATEQFVRDNMGQHVSDLVVRWDRTINVLSTRALAFSGSCIPKGYAKTITFTGGFTDSIQRGN